MGERRTRRPRPDQRGRDARRSSRAERRSANAAARRAPGPGVDRERPARVIGRRRNEESAAKPERTVFGMSTARALILAVVVCALALTLAVPLRTYFTQRAEAERVEAERVQLEQDISQLREKKQQQQDPAYIAAEARERLRLVMPGETPYQVQLPGAYEAEQARLNPPPPRDGTWYSDLWHSVSAPPPSTTPAPAPPPPPPAPAPSAPKGPGG